jgi:hypothetical protein
MYPAAMFNSAGKNSGEKRLDRHQAGDALCPCQSAQQVDPGLQCTGEGEVVIHLPVGHDRINRS